MNAPPASRMPSAVAAGIANASSRPASRSARYSAKPRKAAATATTTSPTAMATMSSRGRMSARPMAARHNAPDDVGGPALQPDNSGSSHHHPMSATAVTATVATPATGL